MILEEMPIGDVQHRDHSSGFHPRAEANQIEKKKLRVGDWFYVPTAFVIVQWDGEEWIRHEPGCETFRALAHYIKPEFKPLILK